MVKKTGVDQFKTKGKAKGWFFSEEATISVIVRGIVIGQLQDDSCLAACARMLAADKNIQIPESHLRELLKIDDGGYLSDLPQILQQIGISAQYHYRRDLTIEELRRSLISGDAIVYLENKEKFGHAVVVENITDMYVILRDPLPAGEGRGYQVRLDTFLEFWLIDSVRGRAVFVVN